jgi:DNA recombination protein RmuC
MDLLLALLLGLALGFALTFFRTTGLRAELSASQLREARLRAGDADVVRGHQSVTQLVDPLREQLGRVEDQLQALEVDRARASAELREQVSHVSLQSQQLGRQTRSLVDALRRPQARGVWGELQLRRVVELAGMMERCDFIEQASVASGSGVLRPDLIISLAGGGCVAVDAKVTLAAYLEAVESDDERVREERIAAHARHLRQHIDRLADKAYWQALPQGPEFVVLFLPGEAFLAPALEVDPSLLEYAMTRRVHLATPTTLLSVLRAVAYAWQRHQLADNAQEVFAAGKELFARLATFGGHVDKLGRSLGTAVADFNKTVGSLERTVLPSARRMTELGLDGQLPSPTPVEEVPRPVSAPHLVALSDPPAGGDAASGPISLVGR